MRWAAALLLAGCGSGVDGSGQLPLELTISRAHAELISAFQVAVVSNGRSLDCAAAQANCLVEQVQPPLQLLPVSDGSGQPKKAAVFPASLSSDQQDVSVRGIPVGKNYAVVVEALSKDSPPKLFGSSCSYVQEIREGTNATVVARIAPYPSGPLACDPRIER